VRINESQIKTANHYEPAAPSEFRLKNNHLFAKVAAVSNCP